MFHNLRNGHFLDMPRPIKTMCFRPYNLAGGVDCISCHYSDGKMHGPNEFSALLKPHPVASIMTGSLLRRREIAYATLIKL